MKDWTIAEVAVIPNCDICADMKRSPKPAVYDGAMRVAGNPWAYFCEDCWLVFSTRELGLGKGQRLVLVK